MTNNFKQPGAVSSRIPTVKGRIWRLSVGRYLSEININVDDKYDTRSSAECGSAAAPWRSCRARAWDTCSASVIPTPSPAAPARCSPGIPGELPRSGWTTIRSCIIDRNRWLSRLILESKYNIIIMPCLYHDLQIF